MNRRPVALFMPSLHGGGAERVMLEIAAELGRRGITVHLVLVRAEGHYRDVIPDGVEVFDLLSRRTATSLLKVVAYIRRERPVAVLSTLIHANVIALVAKALLLGRIRVVTRIANTYSAELASGRFKHRLALRLFRLLMPLADAVVCVSKGVADDFKRVAPGSSGKIATVYNPVPAQEIEEMSRESPRHPWFAAQEPPVILAVGRLTAVKDHTTLLRAFADLAQVRSARLVILGEGPERESLLRLASQLGVSEHVGLPGFKVNPFAYMSRASVFVLSSRHEGFPNVLVQAMACRTPVVSTDCPSGPLEILENGRWGQLVPIGDWQAMSYAIARALDGPSSIEVLATRASQFSVTASVDRYLEILGRGQG